ncbi:MAG: type I DNA topoisomerase [Proteobacteria bacterium]|nr:type I DNA topoisomerase [Pseudomonadota bacterium]
MNVVIVESPAKAKTINKYLGPGFKVLASFGHVRDLPSKDGSVKPDQDFAMSWEIDAKAKKHLKEIADAVKGADALYLATDPDREGEAIAWHVLEILKARKLLEGVTVHRVAFNQITKSAITKAMAEPRELDQQLINAYLARRALDYLVGFTLSPVLWRKLPGAKSAGRVQSVALRLIVDRELEIDKFIPEEYWSVRGAFIGDAGAPFEGRLTSFRGEKLEKKDIRNEARAREIEAALKDRAWRVTSVEKKPQRRHPYAPFTTSTLQQEAARKLGFSARQTMQVAQRLYEGKSINGEVTGLITYMRTDGVSIAGEAIAAARSVIEAEYGKNYLPASPRMYKSTAKNAQEAHEAIRPTDLRRKPGQVAHALDKDERGLYELIWKRTLASQMEAARLELTTVNIEAADGLAAFRASGTVTVFDGYRALYREGRDDHGDGNEEARLPAIREGETPSLNKIITRQHFTEPAPRFSEATLVKKLEQLGIGRPSTYASILSVLRRRNYVRMEKKRFVPEDNGIVVTAFLESFFDRYVEYDFTANLEEQLDKISAGQLNWKEVLRAFWQDFQARTDEVLNVRTTVVLDKLNEHLEAHIFQVEEQGADPRKCLSCDDGRLSLKTGRYGVFIGCSNYPECRFTKQLGTNSNSKAGGAAPENDEKILGQDPETGKDVKLKSGRFGPYVELGEKDQGGGKPKRASIPKDVPLDELGLEKALKLLSLPRIVGAHPETGKEITAAIGRYGPYLAHDGSFASLASTEEVFSVGVNRAVVVLAEKKSGARRGAVTLKELGPHPEDGKIVKVLDGRYGPYVTHNRVNATVPKGVDPETLTLEQGLALLAAKAARKGSGKGRAKKS